MKKNLEIKKLGEVCNFEGGSQPPKSNFIYEPKEGYVRFLQIRDFASDKYITYIPDSKKNRHCDVGDILLGRYGASVGKILINKKGAYNVAVMKTIPNTELIDKNYFYYYLISDEFQRPLSKVASRSAQAGFSKDDIYNFPVLTPSHLEQKRIVEILDEAIEKIAKAKENAEKNLKNSKDLFESYLQSLFAKLGRDWEEKTLGDIGKPSMCKRILKHQTSPSGEIPFYKIGTFGKKPNAFISKELYNEFRTKYSFPKKGDILISASGTIGRRVRYDGEPAFFQDSNIVWIDNDEKQVLNDYLFVFYEFCDWQPSKGATIARLYNSNLTSIKIVFPKSLSEQKALVNKIDIFSEQTKKLEANYKQKIADLDELKKSLLTKAFAGEL